MDDTALLINYISLLCREMCAGLPGAAIYASWGPFGLDFGELVSWA